MTTNVVVVVYVQFVNITFSKAGGSSDEFPFKKPLTCASSYNMQFFVTLQEKVKMLWRFGLRDVLEVLQL